MTIWTSDCEEPFELTVEEDAALAESVAQIERGDWISGDELLRQIDRRK